MNRQFSTAVKFLLVLSLLVPAAALSFGSLKDIKYKIKGTDGNRWAHLAGKGRIVRGGEAKGKITFTFDDGPDHRTTPVLLDQLDRYGVKGTFFVNGHRFHSRTAGAEENKAVLREIYRRGHYLGNHTFTHEDITKMDRATWNQEISQVGHQIQEVTGRRPWLFRPPFGKVSTAGAATLKEQGYTIVMWNLDPLDWKAKTPRELLERSKKVIEENPDGGIFLLHDTNRNTAQAFPLIMEWLQERNAELKAMEKKASKW